MKRPGPHAALLALCLFTLPVAFAFAADVAARPGEKEAGEEEQIRERRRWFRERREGDGSARTEALRAEAARSLLAARGASSGRSPDDLVWAPLGPAPMTMLGWAMGSVAGRVDALAVHPTNENTLYLGAAAGGVWKSTNGGALWAPVFDEVGTETIGSITLDATDPERVWVGTGEHAEGCWGYFGMGLFLSTDGGGSWTPKNGAGAGALELSYIATILLHPTDSQRLLVSGHGYCADGGQTTGGIFRSADAGESWTRVFTGSVGDLTRDPANPMNLLAAVGEGQSSGHGIYRSTNGGDSWTQVPYTSYSPTPVTVGRLRLARSTSSPATLYTLANVQGGTWIYKSTDNGVTWTRTNTSACGGQCSYNLTLDVHPTDPATILFGTILFARSTNSGSTFQNLTSGWGSAQKVHQDTHIVRYSRLTPNRFWVGSDGGLWRTDNGDLPPATISFANLNAGLNIAQFYDVAVHPDDSTLLFGGAQDNSSSGRFLDEIWDVTTVTGDGFMNLVDPSDPEQVYQTSYPSGGLPSLIYSSSGGAPGTFCWVNTNGIASGPFPWVTPLAIFDLGEATATQVFVASDRVFRRDAVIGCAATPAWTAISGDLTPGSGSSISMLEPVAAGGATRLYVATSNGLVQRSDNADGVSVTFLNVSGNLPARYITDIEADPVFPGRVYATHGEFGGAKLFRSDIGGTSWTAVGAGLPDLPANAVAVDPRGPDRIFVANDVGVYISVDFGETFTPVSDGLPLGVPVVDLEIDDEPHALVAGTYGRGAWLLALDDLRVFADGFESSDTAAWSLTQF